MSAPVDRIEREAALVAEALVREIRDAARWAAVVEAWEALLKVRRMADSLAVDRPTPAAQESGDA